MRVSDKILSLLVLAPMGLLLGACSRSDSSGVDASAASPALVAAAASTVEAPAPAANVISGTIVETMDAAGYTYVLVDTGTQKVWAAGPPAVVKVGEEINLTGGMAMTDFHSQALDRTFDVIFFVGNLTGIDGAALAQQGAGIPQEIPGHSSSSQKAAPEKTVDLSNVQKVSGGNTIAELFAGKEELADKEAAVRGRVVKFNAGIMGRNWIHIQDGSGSEGSNDLTVTTDGTAQIGDLVVVRGTLKTNQDFGHGYSYDLLIEEAKVDVE